MKRQGFTLVEMLVVIAIIGVLAALTLPAVQAAREAARRSTCANNLKQSALAIQNYHVLKKKLPPGGLTTGNQFSWHVFVLPHLEQDNLYKAFDRNAAYDNAANLATGLTGVDTYLCPSGVVERSTFEQSGGAFLPTVHYQGNMGPIGTNPVDGDPYPSVASGQGDAATGGVLYADSEVKLTNITDGTTTTFMLGEVSWSDANSYRAWTRGCKDTTCAGTKSVQSAINARPYTTNFNWTSFGSNHPGGAQFAMCDGSVTFIAEFINLNTYKALASRKGKETVGDF